MQMGHMHSNSFVTVTTWCPWLLRSYWKRPSGEMGCWFPRSRLAVLANEAQMRGNLGLLPGSVWHRVGTPEALM